MLGRTPSSLTNRHAGILILSLVLGLICSQAIPDTNPLSAAVKVVLGALGMSLLPGFALFAYLRPLRNTSCIDLATVCFGFSLGLVQLFTLISLILHIPLIWIVWVLLLAIAAGGARLIWWAGSSPTEICRIEIDRNQVLAGMLVALIAVLMYLEGSPMDLAENLTHYVVSQRLAHEQSPSIYNFFFTPGTIYTYPFPGIHYFIAMVSRAGNVDTVFTYHKLRFLWPVITLCVVYSGARLVFRFRGVAICALFAGGALILGGTLTIYRGLIWAQLAPVSHAGDVAMGVLLPLTLVFLFAFLSSWSARAKLFFGLGLLLLVAQLGFVHPREFIQLSVYLVCLVAALLFFNRNFPFSKSLLRRTLIVFGCSAAFFTVYYLWHKANVGHVDVVVVDRKRKLLEMAAGMSFQELFANILTEYVYYPRAIRDGWYGFLVLLSPLIFLIFRKSPLNQMIALSIFVYLLIIRFPIFSIPFIYLTYYEILVTPVRNFVWFLYLMIGAIIYILYAVLNRYSAGRHRAIAFAGAITMSLLLGLSIRTLDALFARSHDWLYLPVLAMLALLFLASLRQGGFHLSFPFAFPTKMSLILVAGLIVPAAIITKVPARSPFKMVQTGPVANTPDDVYRLIWKRWTGGAKPSAYPWAEKSLCRRYKKIVLRLGSREKILRNTNVCYPSFALTKKIRERLPPDSVLATNAYSRFIFAPFVLGQINWPAAHRRTVDDSAVFENSFNRLNESLDKYGVQPILNIRETPNEKLELLRQLSITHVVLDPTLYQSLRPAFDTYPMFMKILDQEGWAIYEVVNQDS